MILYFIRHGIAAGAAPGQPDHTRALTPQGIHKLKRQVHFVRAAGWSVDRLYTSPYVRARQTAELLAPAFGTACEEQALLKCGCTFDDLVELLARSGRPEGVAVVGHQPDLSQLVQALTGCVVMMRKGMVAVVDVARVRRMGGTLVGLYDPDVTARAGAAAEGA